ncbi:MAG: hypothetical protein EOP09_08475 [Proteobacteria bacterium]|nr:MAG: hypothetical protein EOP09_08475 [Pseudomonadota bacterium]
MIKVSRPVFMFAILAFGPLIGACNFREDKLDGDEDSPLIAEADLHYSVVNDKVIRPYCLSCHSAAGGNQGGVNIETFANVTAQLPNIKGAAIENLSMPPASATTLPTSSYNLLKAWIEAGGPE